jgi:hypothetical protein
MKITAYPQEGNGNEASGASFLGATFRNRQTMTATSLCAEPESARATFSTARSRPRTKW